MTCVTECSTSKKEIVSMQVRLIKFCQNRGCCKNALIQGFKMSPHPKPFYGQPFSRPDPEAGQWPIKGLGIEDRDYQVGARFKALDEGVLAAASKSTGYFLPFQFPRKCDAVDSVNRHELSNRLVPHFCRSDNSARSLAFS